jgi:2-polyprenyl-3-methyl-5-hydroxy-6-metoxy-1,4-benzoquinol methylase
MIDERELKREEEFWDRVGTRWLNEMDAERLRVSDAGEFLSGSTVAFEYLEQQLGDVRGLRVLDYGCGSGWLSTYLAQKGALVQGFDISQNLVELGMKRAGVNGVAQRVELKKMIAERLEYPDNSFDRIIGISILHHISLDEGRRELQRVLKPGGSAFFIEPLGESWLQNAIRNYVLRLHHGHLRAVDAEHPLTYHDIHAIGSRFQETELREFQLTEMIARITGDRVTKALKLRRLDTFLLRKFPSLKKYCRLVVIRYGKH